MESQTTTLSDAEITAMMSLFAIGGIIVLIVYVLMAIAGWKLFTKAGESGWKALIPIYNSWVFLRLGDQAGWWALVAFIPLVQIVSVVFMAIAAYNIGLKLGKEGWWVVLYLIVPIIWLFVLAFDKSTWKSAAPGVVPSPIDATPEQPAFQPANTPEDTETHTPETKPPLQL